MDQVGKMESKRVLVTGAGTGIGRAIAVEFARQGAAVAVHYSHSGQGASVAVEEILRAGGKARAFQADFNRTDLIQPLIEKATGFLGGLDVLINNAGISMNEPFEKVSLEQFDTLFNVNVRTPFFLTQAAVPFLAKPEGCGVVINMTSIQAFGALNEHSVYSGTKGAIVAITRELAIELAPQGIRVNAIAPGAVEVENYYKAEPDFDAAAFGRLIPCGFLGQPEDVARVALFLASEDARYIIGQTIIADGGTLAWYSFSEDFQQKSAAKWGTGYVPGR